VARRIAVDRDEPVEPRARTSVFLFFSNRLGCLGSLLVSVLLTAVVVWAVSR